MGGHTPISDLELAAWMINQQVNLNPWEARAVRHLSREYAAMLAEAIEPNTPPPWVDPNIMTEERRVKIAKAMSDWANAMNAKTRN